MVLNMIQSKNSENNSDISQPIDASEPEKDFAAPPDPIDELRDSFGEGEEDKDSTDKMPEATVLALSDMIVYGLDILHDEIADAYNYEPMRLSDKEKEMWTYCLKQVVPYLPIKYAVLVVTAIILSLAEGRKFIGLAMDIKKRKG